MARKLRKSSVKLKPLLASQREKLKKQRSQRSKSRIEILQENIKYISDPEDIMIEIVDLFKETHVIPEVGNYYTFIYNAKTPNLLYDQHPLIAAIENHRWGFRGLNFHWNEIRNYTWNEVAGFLHVVEDDEIMSMRNINYAKYMRK